MIYIESQSGFEETDPLERAARLTLDHQAAPAQADLTIVLADDEKLRVLNHTYLGIDSPTDVLSFPASEFDPDSGLPYLGDIIISTPRAAQQAHAAGHSVQAELQLLVVHGVLHLLGYDHARTKAKATMWKAQGEILERLGLEAIQIREE